MSRQRGNRSNYERLYDNRGQHASEGGTITNINYQSNVNPLGTVTHPHPVPSL